MVREVVGLHAVRRRPAELDRPLRPVDRGFADDAAQRLLQQAAAPAWFGFSAEQCAVIRLG
jgi:hypothetical protein